MIKHALWSKSTPRGVAAIVYDGTHLHGTLDGEDLGIGLIQRLNTPKGDVTHYLDTTPAIGLTAAEAGAIHAKTAELHSADPRTQREALVSTIRTALDDMTYHRNRDDNGTGIRFADAARAEAKLSEARAALEAFDLAHPALVEQIRTEAAIRSAERERAANNA